MLVHQGVGEVSSGSEIADFTHVQALMADFFFVLLVLGWFLLGLGEKATLQSSKLLDAWYPLWQWVFQPALGVLMLGALASGVAGKFARESESSQAR